MKLSNIKHLILTTILCALTVFTAKAEVINYGVAPNTASVDIDAELKTITITGTGDLSLVANTNVPYYFTATAAGNVFTASDGSAAVGVETDGSLNTTYYVRSQYAKTTDPATASVTGFRVKTYYVKEGGNYTCAFGSAYDEGKTYATASATMITDANKGDFTVTSYVFNAIAITNNTEIAEYGQQSWGMDWVSTGVKVNVGDQIDLDSYYWVYGGKRSGAELVEWGWGTPSTTFKSINGIYKKEAEIYTPISSTAYDPAKTYYSVNFTDLDESGKSAMASNVENFETITTVKGLPNPSGVYYFDGVNYTEVNNGDLYHEGAYYVLQDNYTEKSYGELAELGYAYHNEVTPFWEIIENDIKNNAITEVVLNSKTKALAEIDYTITQRLMHCSSIKTLDLGEVQIDHFDSYDKLDASYKQIGTFVDYTKHYTNKVDAPIEKLVLPHIKTGNEVNGKMHYHVPSDLCLTLSDHLHKIVMSDNATCLERQAFDAIELTDITLNEGLRVIGEEAFNSMHADVLVIPSTMEYIGVGAFGQGYVHDVYFLGTTAPIVEMDAFGSMAYVNNNANIQPNTVNDPISHGDVALNPKYAATRDFYFNGDYAAAVLHLPKKLTAAQRAAYTDVTRDYHVFDTYRNATSEEQATYGQEGSNVIKSTDGLHYLVQIIKGDGHDIEYKYIDGNNETYGLWQAGDKTQDYVMRTFWNGTVGDYDTSISSLGGFKVSTYNSFNSGIPGAGITGGQTSFYDYYVGSKYHWPGQSAYCRSYAVATNNILWDGTTTIAQGIVNKEGSYTARKYDINCDGDMTDDGEAKWADGSEYIGLHQFVLVTSDIEPEQTPEEIPFKTIKGGNWYSFCYPVNMTVKQVREVFGEDTQVCKFNQVDRVVEGDDKMIRLYFTDEQCLGNKNINDIAISANVSYMIRPSTYFDEDDVNYANMYFKFSDYQLDGKQVPQETNVKAVDISSEGKVAGDDYTFIGQYMTQADGTAITMPK